MNAKERDINSLSIFYWIDYEGLDDASLKKFHLGSDTLLDLFHWTERYITSL